LRARKACGQRGARAEEEERERGEEKRTHLGGELLARRLAAGRLAGRLWGVVGVVRGWVGLCERRACLGAPEAERRERGGERGRRGGFSLSLFLLLSSRPRAAVSRRARKKHAPRTLTCLVRAMASDESRSGAERCGEEEGGCVRRKGCVKTRRRLLFFSLF
jgi:hypothetical protein